MKFRSTIVILLFTLVTSVYAKERATIGDYVYFEKTNGNDTLTVIARVLKITHSTYNDRNRYYHVIEENGEYYIIQERMISLIKQENEMNDPN